MTISPSSFFETATIEKLKSKLLAGNAREVEEKIFTIMQQKGAGFLQQLLNEITDSPQGLHIARELRTKHNFKSLRKKEVTVTVKGGQKILVSSWYSLLAGKKKGPFKKGRNGRGNHLLLSYWGFTKKCSPGYLNDIARCGVGSISYDAAQEELRAQGISIDSTTIDHMVQHVGTLAETQRDSISIEKNESLAGKRVKITIDGGRIRSRQTKTGRPKKGHKFTGFETPWKEPKLLVIAELDENGKKKKGSKPLYEATMKGSEDVLSILVALCQKLGLREAKEIVCSGDGAEWIWNLFEKLITYFQIGEKTIRIADYYHAVEHLTSLAACHIQKSESEQTAWAKQLSICLREGKFDLVKQLVTKEAETHKLPELTKAFEYFEHRREYMHYDQYEARKLPIGSGIVESAVKRVINSRIKAPGSFWKLENVEKILQLRSALMAGRWNIFMNNLFETIQLTV